MKNERMTPATQEAVTCTTLCREASAEFEEKKSIFIGHAKPIKTEEEALAIAEIEMTSHVSLELQGAEILTRESEWSLHQTENGAQLVLTWKIVCIEDIAEEVPLGVEG